MRRRRIKHGLRAGTKLSEMCPHSGTWKITPPGGWGSCYITYVPGIVMLCGDAGDLSLYHYQAMDTLQGAVNWLANNGDTGYLMSKAPDSMRRRVLDRKGTARMILSTYRDADKEHRATIRARLDIDLRPTLSVIEYRLSGLMEHEVADLCVLTVGDYGTHTYTVNDLRLVAIMRWWAKRMQKRMQRRPGDG